MLKTGMMVDFWYSDATIFDSVELMKSITSLFITLFLLSGCASKAPTHISLNPTLPQVSQQTDAVVSLMLNTVDARKDAAVVRFIEEGKIIRAVSLGEPIAKQLNQVYRQGMTHSGYQIDPAATNSLQFQVAHIQTDVIDTTFGYDTKTRISITALAKNAHKTLTKTYNVRGTNEGAFTPDFATLELEFNKLLAELNQQILNDPELHQFLQQ
jgi:uncharacterized lipoprotein